MSMTYCQFGEVKRSEIAGIRGGGEICVPYQRRWMLGSLGATFHIAGEETEPQGKSSRQDCRLIW